MATRFVAQTGSNTAPYSTWATAATTLATALAASTAAGDIIVIDVANVPTADKEVAANTTWTFAGNIFLVAGNNTGASSYTLAQMGTTTWLGNSTASRSITFAGADRQCYVYGLTIRYAGTTVLSNTLASSAGQSMIYENCYFWNGGTGTSNSLVIAAAAAWTRLIACTFRTAALASGLSYAGDNELIKCVFDAASSIPNNMFVAATGVSRSIGCDYTKCTGNIVANLATDASVEFDRCTFNATATALASQTTNPTFASPRVWISNSLCGTNPWQGYWDALGSCVAQYSTYFTGSAAGAISWLVTTTANSNTMNPFRTPWIDFYNTTLTAITPYLETLRPGNATLYTDLQAWAETSWPNTASSPIASGWNEDSATLLNRVQNTGGVSQDAGAGTGAWTAPGSPAASMKLGPAASITPTVAGFIRMRVVFTVASASIAIDPVVRT